MPDVWESVRLAFQVSLTQGIDPALRREGERVAQVLLDHAPRDGWPVPASGVVTREHAMRSLAAHALGTPRDLDAAGLLEWSRDPRGSLALKELDAQARDALLPWLRERTGVGCGPVIDLAVRGDGTDGVPLGLVAGVAWRAASVGRARGHVEARLGVRSFSENEALRWAELCEAWLLRKQATDSAAADVVLDRADAARPRDRAR